VVYFFATVLLGPRVVDSGYVSFSRILCSAVSLSIDILVLIHKKTTYLLHVASVARRVCDCTPLANLNCYISAY